uniref:GIY-YIG homing endonuclease n=1 Tax=Cyathus pallidus TaxID=380665 RepID=UPI0025520225
YEHSPNWFNKDNFLIFNSIAPFFLYSNNSFLRYRLTNVILSSFKSFKSLKSFKSTKSYNYLANDPKIVDNFIKDKNLNPIYKYENLDSKEIIERVSKEIKHISGIYLILNKITLDYYIGSASTNRMYSRFTRHLIYLTGSKIVKLAIKKYGLSNFSFLVLEIFPDIVTQENNKQLLDLEDFYLKSLLPNYNILTEAGSSFGYKHTEITRINLSTKYSLERRLRIGELNKDKTLSTETIEKMRSKALDREPYNYSEKGKLNLKKRSKSLLVYNLNGTLYGEYPSLKEASKSLNSSLKTINRCLKTDTKILKRQWILKFKN